MTVRLSRSTQWSDAMFALQMGIPGGPELLVVGVLFLILPFVLAYWVYNDAEERVDENVRGDDGFRTRGQEPCHRSRSSRSSSRSLTRVG